MAGNPRGVAHVPAAVRPTQPLLPSQRAVFVSGSIFFSFLFQKSCGDAQIEVDTHCFLMPEDLVGTNYFGWQDWADLAKSGVCHSSSKPLLLVWELSSGDSLSSLAQFVLKNC